MEEKWRAAVAWGVKKMVEPAVFGSGEGEENEIQGKVLPADFRERKAGKMGSQILASGWRNQNQRGEGEGGCLDQKWDRAAVALWRKKELMLGRRLSCFRRRKIREKNSKTNRGRGVCL